MREPVPSRRGHECASSGRRAERLTRASSRSLAVRGRAQGAPTGKSLMQAGLRVSGKTALRNRFARIAEESGLAGGFIEAPESGGFRPLLAKTPEIQRVRHRAGAARQALFHFC